jgi:hypothetical protein
MSSFFFVSYFNRGLKSAGSHLKKKRGKFLQIENRKRTLICKQKRRVLFALFSNFNIGLQPQEDHTN